MPKLDGNRVALRGRVFPEVHQLARQAADAAGLSLSDYLTILINQDAASDTTARSSALFDAEEATVKAA